MTEADQIRRRYARRPARSQTEADSLIARECSALFEHFLTRHGMNRRNARVLDIGCGTGGVLGSLPVLGFEPANLSGIDLIVERVATACELLPAPIRVRCADAAVATLPPESCDLILLFTVLSSVLDDEMRTRIAANAWYALAPGGCIAIFDMRFPNPLNRDVKPVRLSRVRVLFPQAAVESATLTVTPPLARAAVRLHPALYRLLTAVPWLHSHRFYWIQKRSIEAAIPKDSAGIR